MKLSEIHILALRMVTGGYSAPFVFERYSTDPHAMAAESGRLLAEGLMTDFDLQRRTEIEIVKAAGIAFDLPVTGPHAIASCIPQTLTCIPAAEVDPTSDTLYAFAGRSPDSFAGVEGKRFFQFEQEAWLWLGKRQHLRYAEYVLQQEARDGDPDAVAANLAAYDEIIRAGLVPSFPVSRLYSPLSFEGWAKSSGWHLTALKPL